MNILIPNEWLREFLKTKATPKQIADNLSLCGPSVEKVDRTPYGAVYQIEVTTNRVDSASVYGIARETAAILPRFKLNAKLTDLKAPKLKFAKFVNYLRVNVNSKLCPRFTAVLIRNVKLGPSPNWMKERLLAVGVRPINNVVDISNYIMAEIGQPVHTFDYNKIKGAEMILRESARGEKITTLDGKSHSLTGGDIVIEDGTGRLIDLAGIMGAENSAVDEYTKNVLFFVQTYNPVNIRRTSMSLAHRTGAAMLFEKGLDPELVEVGISRGIALFEKITHGKAAKEILDIYPSPYQVPGINLGYDFLVARLGIEISKTEVSKILTSLGFETNWTQNKLKVTVPSFRAGDTEIPEDIVEEVARIYGYHNLPSTLMAGAIPEPLRNTPFKFEDKVKNLLSGWGGIEVYTLSLVPEDWTNESSLKLKNALGAESEYLRTSLFPSLVAAARQNKRNEEPFHLFEIANVYLPKTGELPEERMTLAGIFANIKFREAKGLVEALLESLNFKLETKIEDLRNFLPNHRLAFYSGSTHLGEFGVLEDNNYSYYEFSVEALKKVSKPFGSFHPIPKYPAQIEDITLTFPERTKIGEVIGFVLSITNYVSRMELIDTYENSYTFRIWYQNPKKTLTNAEVEKEREKILKELGQKFGASI